MNNLRKPVKTEIEKIKQKEWERIKWKKCTHERLNQTPRNFIEVTKQNCDWSNALCSFVSVE